MDVGSIIYITDDEWQTTAFDGVTEGTLRWTNNMGAVVPAGTVLIFSNVDNLGSGANAMGANIGLLEDEEAGFSLFQFTGDIVYAYMGTRVAPVFLAAFTFIPTGFVDNGNDLPSTGLTDGTTAINLSALNGGGTPDGAKYIGLRTATNMSDYLANLNNAANWLFNDDGESLLVYDDTEFIGTPTAITFSALTGESSNALPAFLVGVVALLLVSGGLFVLRRNRGHNLL